MKERRKNIAVITAILIALLCVEISAPAYAWLSNFFKGGNFGFGAGELPPYTLEVARISYSDNRDETSRIYYPCRNYNIETDESGAHLAVDVENMTFGTIDNVAQLKPENIVYLRLTVPKSTGDTVSLNLHYTQENFITLYKKENTQTTGEVTVSPFTDESIIKSLIEVQSDKKAGDSFLLYDAVVSNDEWDADEISENVQFAADENDFMRFGTDGTALKTLTNEQFDSVVDDYYVYIKVIPNLAVFAYSVEYLSAIMPCYMYFGISAVFDAEETSQAA